MRTHPRHPLRHRNSAARSGSLAPRYRPLIVSLLLLVCFVAAVRSSGVSRVFASQMSTFVRSKPHLNIGTIGHVDHGQNAHRDATRASMTPLFPVSPSAPPRAHALLPCLRVLFVLSRQDHTDRSDHEVHG